MIREWLTEKIALDKRFKEFTDGLLEAVSDRFKKTELKIQEAADGLAKYCDDAVEVSKKQLGAMIFEGAESCARATELQDKKIEETKLSQGEESKKILDCTSKEMSLLKSSCAQKAELAALRDELSGEVNIHIDRINDFMSKLDGTWLTWNEERLNKVINNWLSEFRAEIDEKILGTHKYVNEKVAIATGSRENTVELMRKIAVLEGVAESIQGVRPLNEIIAKKDEYLTKISNNGDTNSKQYETVVNTLKWVLGEDKNG